jgi:two-component system, NtrC family, sensor histidine kinase PilS
LEKKLISGRDKIMNGENLEGKIKGLILSRVAIATFLLGIFIFLQIKAPDFLTQQSISFFYGIIVLIYFLSLVFSVLSRISTNHRVHIYLQTMTDVVMITALIYVTGGIRSTYAVFYPLVIIYSVLYLGRNGGLITASAASIFYGLLIDLEYYRVINPISHPYVWEVPDTAGHVFLRIFVNILSFYLIALLASFVVEKEKKTRALLAEKESAFNQLDLLYRSIIESVDAGILTIDLEGRIKSFNRAAEQITGWTFNLLENHSIQNIIPAWKELYVNRLNDDGSVKGRFEMPVVVLNDRRLILGCALSALRDNSGQKIGDILIFQDLTKVKEMEAVLERNRRLAFVGEMAAGLAHEIRNPLASISGSIQMLMKESSMGTTEGRLMRVIMRGKDQLEGFVKDFLLLARHNRGPHHEVLIGDVIGEVLEAAGVMPDWNSNIEIRETLEEGSAIKGNREEMRQLLWNLILNAAQSMPEGGRLDVGVREKNLENHEGLEIIVADNGVGITEENKKLIFEPFFTTKERGTGLGLAIVMRIVNSYGGNLLFESTSGVGTKFVIWLPKTGFIPGGENGKDTRR